MKCQLTELILNGNELDDEAALCIARLKSLREVDVRETRIGDFGVARLVGLPRLESLAIGRDIMDRNSRERQDEQFTRRCKQVA
jgi:hypothetical protein